MFDPTDLPPPYCSQNPSLADSQGSLTSPECSSCRVKYSTDQDLSFVHTNLPSSVSQVQNLAKAHTTIQNTNTQGVNTNVQNAVTQVQFPAGRDPSEPYMSFHSAVHNEHSTMQIDNDISTCSTPSGIAHLAAGNPSSDSQSVRVTQSSGQCLTSGTSCLSRDPKRGFSSDRELSCVAKTDSRVNENAICRDEVGVVNIEAQHPSSALIRSETEFCEFVPDVSDLQRHNNPVSTICSLHRGVTVLSLRARSSSLGENSIYVNSFEVLPRPPPNMRIPPDELGAPSSADDLNTKSAEQHLTKRASRSNDALLEPRGIGRRERRKETTRHKRRKHLYDSPKHKDKRDASDKCKVNKGHEDPVASGRETIV